MGETGTRVRIPFRDGSGLELEGKAILQRERGEKGEVGILLTHPYAPLGGNMENNVVMHLFRHYGSQGYSVLRFNFRGVGKSQGSGSWSALSEEEDVRASVRFLLDSGIKRVILVGYSYGSVVASSVADDFEEIRGYVSIAYPFGYAWALTLFHSKAFEARAMSQKPKLFLVGSMDNFTALPAFRAHVDAFPEPKDLVVLQGADHFFFSREREISATIDLWLSASSLAPPGRPSGPSL